MILILLEKNNEEELNPQNRKTVNFAAYLSQKLKLNITAVSFQEKGHFSQPTLAANGICDVYYVVNELLRNYSPQAYAESLAQIAQKLNPKIVLTATSLKSHEVLTCAGAILSWDVIGQVLDVEVHENKNWLITRSSWGGNLKEVVSLQPNNPIIITNSSSGKEVNQQLNQDKCSEHTFSPQLKQEDSYAWVKKVIRSTKSGIDLKSASVVVGGGRGVGSAEGFNCLDELGKKLKAAVGGSRVTTNNGWRPYQDQIGLTGTHIAPELYIACGISGAIQHMAGCKNSKKILVINKDENAPIIDHADYAVIGDLHEVVPAILECL